MDEYHVIPPKSRAHRAEDQTFAFVAKSPEHGPLLVWLTTTSTASVRTMLAELMGLLWLFVPFCRRKIMLPILVPMGMH